MILDAKGSLGLLFFVALSCLVTSQQERSTVPSSWTLTVSNVKQLTNTLRLPSFDHIPDAHLSVINNTIYFSGSENFRSKGTGPTVEEQLGLDPPTAIFGGRKETDLEAYDSGGKWFIAVHSPHPGFNPVYVGFFHAESHWLSQDSAEGTAWFSLGVTVSKDGVNWTAGEQIITSHDPKPSTPTYGGAGNGGVVYDPPNKRWFMLWPGDDSMTAAVSYDRLGAPGTWLKYYNGSFSEPGLGGNSSDLILNDHPGANPGIVWHTGWQTWVMVYGGWDGPVYVTVSDDLLNWDEPRVLVLPRKSDGSAWYPTIVGVDDKEVGKEAKLYWADIERASDGGFERVMMSANLTFSGVVRNVTRLGMSPSPSIGAPTQVGRNITIINLFGQGSHLHASSVVLGLLGLFQVLMFTGIC